MDMRRNQTALGPHPGSAPHELCGLADSFFPWPQVSSFMAMHWPLFKVYDLTSSVLSLTISPHAMLSSSYHEMSHFLSNISISFTFWPLHFLSHSCPIPSSVFTSQRRPLLLEQLLQVGQPPLCSLNTDCLPPSQRSFPCVIFSCGIVSLFDWKLFQGRGGVLFTLVPQHPVQCYSWRIDNTWWTKEYTDGWGECVGCLHHLGLER